MLTISIQLNNDKLNDVISQYHLEDHRDKVYHLSKDLCGCIESKVYYTIINDQENILLKNLNNSSKKNYSSGVAGIITLGSEIDEILEQYKDNPIETHIVDILSNEILLECLYAFKERFVKDNPIKGLSIIYFPGNHLPIELNKEILGAIDTNSTVSINEHYMMKPLNTISFICGEEETKVKEASLCSRCDAVNCPNRKEQIEVTIMDGYKIKKIKVDKNYNLLKALNDNEIYIPQSCTGHKKCGNCKIKVLNPSFEINASDKDLIPEKDLKLGIRLACGIQVNKPLTLSLIKEKDTIKNNTIQIHHKGNEVDDYGIAVDLGTTTVEMALVNLGTREVVGVIKQENDQKRFGLDVLSRAFWASENYNGIKILQKTIINQLNTLIKTLMENGTVKEEQLKKVIIGANTIMSHFIMGLDTEDVVVSPFRPVTTDMHIYTGDLLNINPNIKVIVLPTIASFMGSDILSGMIYTNMNEVDKYSLLIDLGTNGEIVLGKKGEYISCSTAVGPAFEGTHIEKGMGALNGAINIYKSPTDYTVIGNVAPIGLCGSAIIDAIHYLMENNRIDETGLLTDKDMKAYLVEDIYITQQDVRQIQMAKSAVKTGIDILLKETGITYDDIQTVYLTGGFGEYVNRHNAGNIGLIPKMLLTRTKTLHNTSLQGGILSLYEENQLELYKRLSKETKYIELANNSQFQTQFIENINFTK
ncbi:uncharacterized 2Fe-2S/4Fe-4S cluster protein (DUF4445 family) [Natranaerovirga pectinivora]|uniref:Uncharacterized 2Fe-2S/4Fe-4S cluster protein (DUF4445 family) n=1 Tax=Natranaerovirga pectinivora TaxID=682400 RepID=A0A4R3MMW7_9FIRM|nr:ASKHA domain-containing protein [Natranaerovirga pectinivora]TCT16325.1 uncharacterized 2Fe-2S/4Fe-4S cluster protein (DUF4445 family) [Natranaerovirga pectinivora]